MLETIESLAYCLIFPEQYSYIHNMFFVSLLEPWISRDKDNTDPLTIPDLEDDPEEWEVKEVCGKRQTRDGTQYLIK